MTHKESFHLRTAIALALFASSLFAQGPARTQTLSAGFRRTDHFRRTRDSRPGAEDAADKYNFAPATGTPPAGTFDGVRTSACRCATSQP